ncbi:unnamed protein product [Debaryomyces tyrocola]|nr:unnamed protein product [Debaryomyces tyrocola]
MHTGVYILLTVTKKSCLKELGVRKR